MESAKVEEGRTNMGAARPGGVGASILEKRGNEGIRASLNQ